MPSKKEGMMKHVFFFERGMNSFRFKPFDIYWEVFGNDIVVFKHNRNINFKL